jgi:hypothetical protein
MSIPWKPEQAAKVGAVLERHPAKSNECELAAAAIVPIAREVDASARAILIKPAGRARYLCTRVSLEGAWWRHHVTTEVVHHHVDSLTGVPGTPIGDYFAEHYKYPELDAYVLQAIVLEGVG